MPPIVLQIISILSLVTSAIPSIEKLYDEAKKLFATLFAGGIITIEQQERLNAWADSHMEAVLAGEVPPELQVEPDPE